MITGNLRDFAKIWIGQFLTISVAARGVNVITQAWLSQVERVRSTEVAGSQ